VLSGADFPDWNGGAGGLQALTARVSANGRWLAFMSQRPLTGYDNEDVTSVRPGERMDEEVFLYHAPESGSGALVCASCDPTGARPHGREYAQIQVAGGDRIWQPTSMLAANLPGWTPYSGGKALYQSRYLSDSGRLFFNSSDALVPKDVNGTEDVYEFEPDGVGGCSASAGSGGVASKPEGCVGLISSGSSAQESAFLDASQDGSDVFFLTTAKLAAQDFDTAYDVYDAHICTAVSPCPPPPAPAPPPCDTEASCKPAPTPQPQIFGPSGSASFSGPGDLITEPRSPVKPLTRAQELARALKACAKLRRRRVRCERAARQRYATAARRGARRARRAASQRRTAR
jgi:hypothetical protein